MVGRGGGNFESGIALTLHHQLSTRGLNGGRKVDAPMLHMVSSWFAALTLTLVVDCFITWAAILLAES